MFTILVRGKVRYGNTSIRGQCKLDFVVEFMYENWLDYHSWNAIIIMVEETRANKFGHWLPI